MSIAATVTDPPRPSAPPVPDLARELVDFMPTKAYFVGIDYDGCAMDAMYIKHQAGSRCLLPPGGSGRRRRFDPARTGEGAAHGRGRPTRGALATS